MSCSIPNMMIMLSEHVMQLKIITENKLKSPKPCFLKKHTSVLPSSCSFYLSLCVYVCAHSYLAEVLTWSSSASWFFFWLEEDCSDCLNVCPTACWGKSRRAREAFFLPCVISVWRKDRRTNVTVLGHVLACGRAVCWHLDTPCSCFSGSISPMLWTEGSLRQSKNLVKQVENILILFSCWTLSPPWPSRHFQERKKTFLEDLAAGLDRLHRG